VRKPAWPALGVSSPFRVRVLCFALGCIEPRRASLPFSFFWLISWLFYPVVHVEAYRIRQSTTAVARPPRVVAHECERRALTMIFGLVAWEPRLGFMPERVKDDFRTVTVGGRGFGVILIGC